MYRYNSGPIVESPKKPMANPTGAIEWKIKNEMDLLSRKLMAKKSNPNNLSCGLFFDFARKYVAKNKLAATATPAINPKMIKSSNSQCLAESGKTIIFRIS